MSRRSSGWESPGDVFTRAPGDTSSCTCDARTQAGRCLRPPNNTWIAADEKVRGGGVGGLTCFEYARGAAAAALPRAVLGFQNSAETSSQCQINIVSLLLFFSPMTHDFASVLCGGSDAREQWDHAKTRTHARTQFHLRLAIRPLVFVRARVCFRD